MAATLSTILGVLVLLQLSLSVICEAEPCRMVVHQPDNMTAQIGAKSAIIPCEIQPLCSKATVEGHWFVFRKNSHEQLKIKLPKYSSDGRNLSIHSVQANDSGIYYCAATTKSYPSWVPGIGHGTRLVVRERHQRFATGTLLFVLFAIAALYSLIVLILLIGMKRGWGTVVCRKDRKNSRKSSSTRRLHFHAVVQELYRKRNLSGADRTADRNTNYKHTSHEIEFEHPHNQLPDEDVYQNM